MALLDRIRRRLGLLWFALTMPRMAGADDDPPADPPKDDPPKDDPPKDPADDPVNPEDDWKAKARKHERDLKKERAERERIQKELDAKQDADATEQEKALKKAREEAAAEVRTEADKERRVDRLEVAVTRLAAKGITTGEGDDAKTIKFADTEDALLHIQRDAEGLFTDEGKVDEAALIEALADLLKSKPHLAAGDGTKPPADPDTRKGDQADGDIEAMSVEQHAQRKYPTPK